MENPTRRTILGLGLATAGLGGFWTRPGWARDEEAARASDLEGKAVAFLKPRQDEAGSWSGDRKEPGITALVVTALLRSKQVPVGDPVIAKALTYLEGYLGADGGLSGAPHANYSTAIALVAFHEANQGGRYDALIGRAQDFLKGKQWDEGEGKGKDDPFYGGAGYGGARSRPDLSNTAFMLDALHDTGLPANDPAFQRAVVFVSRCQNLKSEFNDQPWADKINDGGFIYTAANGGTSVAGPEAGGLRSYASMTYAGLKSLIYAGLSPDDPRVKAAREYLQKHYDLEENPGLGQRGLYYYYHAFAKTLAALNDPTFVDDAGKSHDWRAELTAALAKRQRPGGSWVNTSDQFMEGDPNLVTAYGLLALSHARPKG